MKSVLAGVAGTLTGVLSAFGVGGGTLLIIYMTAFAGVAQQEAQGINLLYFIPTSLTALISHIKNGLVEKRAVICAALAGVPVSLVVSLIVSGADTGIVKKLFGAFLLVTGVTELFRRGQRGTARE